MMKPTLFLMLGYPGAGKTTVSELIAQQSRAVHLSSDKFRLHMFPKPDFGQPEHDAVYGALDYMTELFLAHGLSVIYDANLNRYRHRKDKYDICERAGASAVLLWLQTPHDLAKQRATELGMNDPARRPYGNLDKGVFDRLAREIEPPHDDERVIKIDGHAVTPDMIANALKQIKS